MTRILALGVLTSLLALAGGCSSPTKKEGANPPPPTAYTPPPPTGETPTDIEIMRENQRRSQ